ncbi:MAG TPA: POTRA domain-containing protein [Pseudolabrys sp.]|nr:POTRA domain-containing protein [Pseudolabrys sp.]
MPRNFASFPNLVSQVFLPRAAALALLELTLVLAWTSDTWAQQPAAAPRYDPRQTEKSIETLQSEQERRKPPVRLPSAPALSVSGADTRPMFRLRAVSIEGAQAVPAETIAAAYQPYLGKTVSKADLASIAVAITELYRAAGFSLSRAIVPPQDINNGRIRIKVIEGYVAEFVLKGDDIDRFGIRPFLAKIIEERPLQLKTLERQLMLVNDIPGVRVADTAFEEIGTTSGKFRLVVRIKTWRIFAGFGFDNMGAYAVGPYEAFATSAFNSYFLPGDSLGFSASTTPVSVREFGFGRLWYDTPVGADGVRLGANALYSNVAPSDIRSQTNTHTITETYEARASYAPFESRASVLLLTGAAGFSDSWERDVFGMTYKDRLRMVSLTADYRLQDNFGGRNYLSVTGRQGLNVFGASSKQDLDSSRPGASPNFSLLSFSFSRLQQLSGPWSVKISATGQWAGGPLLISQQFYLGDAAYGPGFYSGDSGILGYGELRFDQTVSNAILKGYEVYGFFDKGAVWSFDNGGQVLSIASAGVGIRFFFADDWQAGLGVGLPVRAGTTQSDVNSARFLFTLVKSLQLCPQHANWRCS